MIWINGDRLRYWWKHGNMKNKELSKSVSWFLRFDIADLKDEFFCQTFRLFLSLADIENGPRPSFVRSEWVRRFKVERLVWVRLNPIQTGRLIGRLGPGSAESPPSTPFSKIGEYWSLFFPSPGVGERRLSFRLQWKGRRKTLGTSLILKLW